MKTRRCFCIAALLLIVPDAGPGSAFAQSARPGVGATFYQDGSGTGVTFRVWAPNATSVDVTGDFNGWQRGTRLVDEGNGHWSLDVPAAGPGQEYKYVVNDTLWRKDPRGREVTDGGNSVIVDPDAFDWQGDAFTPPWKNDTVIYELHIGSFFDPDPDDSTVATFDDAIARLDYLADLGVNCIDVMPVSEFPGERSWGYNPIDLFAVERTYGGPVQFKRFVREAHARGLAVMLDIVHNHYDARNPDCDLWEFDGWWGGDHNGGIYFYQEDGKCCTIWGRRPHFGRAGVQDFIRDNVFMWLEEYRVDGFRWDSPINIKFYDGVFNAEGYNLIRSINSEIQSAHPGHLSIGEDQNLDMLFDSEWHDSFHGNVVGELTRGSDADRSIRAVRDAVLSGAGDYRTIYVETHDKVGSLNNAERLVTKIDPADPRSYWARKRASLGAILTFTSPGIPLLFMGQEWFEEDPFNDFVPLDWDKAEQRQRARLLFRHLIRLRRNLDGGSAGLKGGQVNILHANDGAKVLAYHRWDQHGTGDDVVVAVNLSATTWGSYDIPFPFAGDWHPHLNSDWTLYGTDYDGVESGPVHVPADGANATIGLGPYSAVVYSRADPPDRDGDRDSLPDTWEDAHGLDRDSPADADLDPDGDGLSNIEEFEGGTDPQSFDALHIADRMAVTGTFSQWDPVGIGMTLTDHYTWDIIRRMDGPFGFKYIADAEWDTSWGDADPPGTSLPVSGTGSRGGDQPEIEVSDSAAGDVLFFRHNETSRTYRVERLAPADADGDSMHDHWEVFYGLSTNDAADAAANADGDEWTNLEEFQNGTHPLVTTPRKHDYAALSLAGDFNNWSLARAPMFLFEDYGWEAVVLLDGGANADFKFVGNEDWAFSWGDSNQVSRALPLEEYGDWQGGNISYTGAASGVYRFRFNQRSLRYEVSPLPPEDADGDGIHDAWERLHGLDPGDDADAIEDVDHDGLTALVEFEYGSDPNRFDQNRANQVSMYLPGNHNGWSPTGTPMELTGHFTWQATLPTDGVPTNLAFKFAADGSWDENWGGAGGDAPLAGIAVASGNNITSELTRVGDYRITFNDHTLQYRLEFVPRAHYNAMNLPGSFNGWDPTAYPMRLVDNHLWEMEATIRGVSNAAFKFVADTDWDTNWGDTNQTRTRLPLFGRGDGFGDNIELPHPLDGRYRFRFNDQTRAFSLVALDRPDADGDGMPDTWERRHGFDPSNSVDGAQNADSDEMSNRQEYRAGTDPTNGASRLALAIHGPVNPGAGPAFGWDANEVTWQYLLSAPASNPSSWRVIATNHPTQAGAVLLLHTNAVERAAWFRLKASRLPPD